MTLTVTQQRLKLAAKNLVAAVGGIEAAAEVLDKGKSTVARWQSVNDEDYSMPIEAVAALEAVTRGTTGAPQVTRELCRLAGGVFVPLPDIDIADDCLRGGVMQISTELGDVARELNTALADGRVTVRERDAVLREINDLIAKAVELRQLVELSADRDADGKGAA